MRRVIAVLLALVIATGAGLCLYAASQRSFATREQFERQRRAVFERHGIQARSRFAYQSNFLSTGMS